MFRAFNVGKWKRKWSHVLVTGRTFVLLSMGSAMFFILLGIGGMMEHNFGSSPLSSMKGIAAQLSTRFFVHMMAMEIPRLPQGEGEETLTSDQVVQFLIGIATNVNPLDPKTLLAGELPGIRQDTAIPLRLSVGNQIAKAPADYPGSMDKADTLHDKSSQKPQPITNILPNQLDDRNHSDNKDLHKVVFIYHSHNRESWNPTLRQQVSNPNDAEKNITLVGKRLQRQLEQRGIGAAHSNTDYVSRIKGYNWNMSYKYSKQTVKRAMSSNKDLQFFFDIHRDSTRRKDSTVTIKGKDYATVYFIIGHRNPDWKRNEQFANEIHERLEKSYPGISRGIWGKTVSQGHGEYNQSLSPNSVVIEIGGVDNTLEETYRTVDVLAGLITDIIHKRKEANPV